MVRLLLYTSLPEFLFYFQYTLMSWNVWNELELVKWYLVMTVLILFLTYLYITHSMLSIYADGGVEDVLKSQCLLHADSIAANNYGTYIFK